MSSVMVKDIHEVWRLRELWWLEFWHLRHWDLWHLWVEIENLDHEIVMLRLSLGLSLILSWESWDGWNPQVVAVSTEVVLLGVLLELDGFLGLVVHLNEVVSDSMSELTEGEVLLNSRWVISKVESHDVGDEGGNVSDNSVVLINHFVVGVALVVLEEHNSSEVIELSEDGVSVFVQSSPDLVVLSEADLLVVEAPVVEVILDHTNVARVSVSPVEINEVVSSGVSIFDGG